jgi:RNA polymerase sigma-32 factor
MERRLSSRDLAFDPAPNAADDDDGHAFTPAAYLPSPEADPAVSVENADWEEASATRLRVALDRLDDRSRHIVESRWLAEEKRTLQDLAGEYGVSAERIRQLEANAIKKMRGLMII